jgi:hypothetical protein
MTDKPDTPSQKAEADQRAKRRSEQLRANLMRRKAQIRSRRSGAEDERGEGLPAAHNNEQSADGSGTDQNET